MTGEGAIEIMLYKCNENLPTPFAIAPTNPRATIATENNAIYSLGTQQRSGEKKQETKIQRYRNVPYSQICVINTISSIMFTHKIGLSWFINCHHVVIYYYWNE